MMKILIERLSSVRVSEPQGTSRLKIFGLRCEGNGGLTYLTLDEALAAKTLDITEVDEGGSVPVLKVVNRGDARVFLMAGEQLVGAKQNRVLNASIMVSARSELPIPVTCVEAGRWRYRSPKFESGGTMSHGLLRKSMSMQAHAGYRSGGTPTSDQGKVWTEVARKLEKMGSASPTQAIHQVYEDYQERLAELLRQLHVPEGCHGVVFTIGGKVAGLDLFDQPVTLAKLWSKLVQAYAIDALEGEGAADGILSSESVNQWVRDSSLAKFRPFKSPGEGHDIRLEADNLVGAALIVDDRPVHVELFAKNVD